jgi:hypothetical protein
MGYVLAHLTFNHLYRMYTDYGGYAMDISTFTMLQVCKLSALSFCYKDGGEDFKSLTKDQQERVVKKLPSILELLSYTYFVSNAVLGVFFEFADYKRFIERTNEYKDVPSPILVSLTTLGKAIAFTGFFVVLS